MQGHHQVARYLLATRSSHPDTLYKGPLQEVGLVNRSLHKERVVHSNLVLMEVARCNHGAMYRIQTCSKINNVLQCKHNMEVTHPHNSDKGQGEPTHLAPEVRKEGPYRVETLMVDHHHKAVVRLNNNVVLHRSNKIGHESILGLIQA